MASYSSKTLMTMLRVFLMSIFLGSLFIDSCIGIRTRGMFSMKEEDVFAKHLSSYFSGEKKTIEIDRLFFTKLPKGVPIPPTAPSKNHNSAPESIPIEVPT
ncbi:protein IDA-like [Dorcoceras hygrometricum]|uniref:Protein IDA-like n=1 Tax=Dorcoceras hygrometricum TaxID=472368 RepID=A0A2Z7CZ36_9LAMI|nr:protein IDA-like [Dorcoceras hygrometricum]